MQSWACGVGVELALCDRYESKCSKLRTVCPLRCGWCRSHRCSPLPCGHVCVCPGHDGYGVDSSCHDALAVSAALVRRPMGGAEKVDRGALGGTHAWLVFALPAGEGQRNDASGDGTAVVHTRALTVGAATCDGAHTGKHEYVIEAPAADSGFTVDSTKGVLEPGAEDTIVVSFTVPMAPLIRECRGVVRIFSTSDPTGVHVVSLIALPSDE